MSYGPAKPLHGRQIRVEQINVRREGRGRHRAPREPCLGREGQCFSFAPPGTSKHYGYVALDLGERASATIETQEIEESALSKGLHYWIEWFGELATRARNRYQDRGLELHRVRHGDTVLSEAEPFPATDCRRVSCGRHPLVDRGTRVRRFFSTSWPGCTDSILSYRQWLHELLSVDDWIPHQNFQGIELGCGDYESPLLERCGHGLAAI